MNWQPVLIITFIIFIISDFSARNLKFSLLNQMYLISS